MSWDSTTTKRTCPCGKSTYTITDESNDWGQSRTYWSMNCRACKRDYALHTFHYYKDGLRNEDYRWVKRKRYDKAMAFQQKAESKRSLAVQLAVDRYLDALIAKFERSNKKGVWQVLRANIKSFKSLGTFYQHTKGKKSQEYLRELFNDYYLEAVLRVLRVKDNDIENLRAEAEALENEAQDLLGGN